MQHARSKGIPCPNVYPTRSGALFTRVKTKPAAVIRFLNGKSIFHPTAHHCAALGEMLAKFHLACSDYPSTRENPLSLNGWKTIADTLRGKFDRIEPGLEALVNSELTYLKDSFATLTRLPKSTIHADLFPNNVFFEHDHISGIIDFYFACTDYLAYDLAICLVAWCFDEHGVCHRAHYDSMLNAYHSARPLTSDEASALNILLRGATLRFLLTRAHDWLHPAPEALVNPLDPKHYSARLRTLRNMK
jgi:homoserine kinase type II